MDGEIVRTQAEFDAAINDTGNPLNILIITPQGREPLQLKQRTDRVIEVIGFSGLQILHQGSATVKARQYSKVVIYGDIEKGHKVSGSDHSQISVVGIAENTGQIDGTDYCMINANGAYDIVGRNHACVTAFLSCRVRCAENATAHVSDNCTVEGIDAAQINAVGNSTVYLWQCAYARTTDAVGVTAHGDSTVHADSGTVVVDGNATAQVSGNTIVRGSGTSTVIMSQTSTGVVNHNVHVVMFDDAQVLARNRVVLIVSGRAYAEVKDTCNVFAFDQSCVLGKGMSTILLHDEATATTNTLDIIEHAFPKHVQGTSAN